MSDNTKIEWTDATWNIITGCSVVSAGCKHCYAMKLAGTRLRDHPSRKGLTTDTGAGPVWNGEVRFNKQWLDQPLRWKRSRMIFVCAHGDLFHESVPDEWIDKVFAVMALCPQHTFQVLTKRPERMLEYCKTLGRHHEVDRVSLVAKTMTSKGFYYTMTGCGFALPNVWLGVSVEDQANADERIPLLLQTPAAVRWVSAEPLLEPITIFSIDGIIDIPDGMKSSLHWVVVGGESGINARPMHPDWARSLRDQCNVAGVPFLFKQWGEWFPRSQWEDNPDLILPDDDCVYENSDKTIILESDDGPKPMHRVGKKAAGRLLDGVQHDEYPVTP